MPHDLTSRPPVSSVRQFLAGFPTPAPAEIQTREPTGAFSSANLWFCACSYGRPGSNLMFSTDQGQTWIHHTVITDSGGFNYTALREISPGRLLYVHDAPKLKALYVDVKVTKK